MLEESERITAWRMVILMLSVYVLGAVFADTVLALSSETRALLIAIDNLVCCVFIADFVGRAFWGTDRKGYLKWGWIDLVSSIPTVQMLRWGRIFRVVRIIRILRGVRSTRHLLAFLFENRVKGTLASVGMVCFVIIVFSSVAILNCETVEEANIKTAGDALWWSFVTMATVGYGDYYPTTPGGRLLAAALMTAGIVLFGTFTAYVASVFVRGTSARGRIETTGEAEQRFREILARLEEREANAGARPKDDVPVGVQPLQREGDHHE